MPGRIHVLVLTAFVTLLWVTPLLGSSQENQPTEETADSELIEETGQRLAQIDVIVSGRGDSIPHLTSDDFELKVGGNCIKNLIVDRVCEDLESLCAVKKSSTKVS